MICVSGWNEIQIVGVSILMEDLIVGMIYLSE
jgi:hypothetical protein